VDARSFRHESSPGGNGLSLVEIGEGAIDIVRNSLHGGTPNPGAAAIRIAGRDLKDPFVSAQRLLHQAKVMQKVSFEALQREAVGVVSSERQTAAYQAKSRFIAVFAALTACRC
jgi:hypothetical protein